MEATFLFFPLTSLTLREEQKSVGETALCYPACCIHPVAIHRDKKEKVFEIKCIVQRAVYCWEMSSSRGGPPIPPPSLYT